MNKSIWFISNRLLGVLGLWVVIGVLSLIWGFFLFAFILSTFVIGFLIISDYNRLDSIQVERAELEGQFELEWGQAEFNALNIVFNKDVSGVLAAVLPPQIDKIELNQKDPDNICFDRACSLGLKVVARKIGFQKVERIDLEFFTWRSLLIKRIEVQTNFGFFVFPAQKNSSMAEFSRALRKQQLLTQGSLWNLKNQSTGQLHSIREYRYPDSLRHIDARKSAKLQKLMTREYDEHINHHVIIGLDLGRAMSGSVEDSDKFNFYLAAAIKLIQHSFKHQDTVTLICFADKVEAIFKQITPQMLGKLYQHQSLLRFKAVASNFNSFLSAADRIVAQRRLLILLSDFSLPYVQESVEVALAFRRKKSPTLLLSLLESQYFLSDLLSSLETKIPTSDDASLLTYSYWLEQRLEQFIANIGQRSAACVQLPSRHWINSSERVYDLLRSSLYS